MNDSLSDMFSRIKNALARRSETVDLPSARMNADVAKVLVEEGYIIKHETLTRGTKKIIRLTLKYGRDKYGRPAIAAIQHLKRVSRPGSRVYMGWEDLRPVQSGYGTSVLSTPRGVMAGGKARHEKLGGEVLAYVW
ncbi:MAG: 30S ribosomal protein S8 [Candidatus Margulisiibacteriota bacterium]